MVRLSAARVIVLPTGFTCELHAPPETSLAMALHAVNLLLARQMVRDVERKTRLRLGTEQTVEEMTPRQMLERYLQVKQTRPERAQVLLEYADRIMEAINY